MSLEVDGERVVEEHYLDSPERYLIYLFHIVTYRFSLPWLESSKVLDYGCGSGYGTHFVAPHCRHITGVDISPEAVTYAQQRYHLPNLDYRQIAKAEEAPLPFDDASFDTVISFQVIEHIPDPSRYLEEILRVLKPGGHFICATPDRSTRLLPGQKPWNVWHIKEYSAEGFRRLLADRFSDVEVLRMGGRYDLLKGELQRASFIKWITLPVTLPFISESIRVSTLHWLKKLNERHSNHNAGEAQTINFSEADLVIAPDAKPSVNLVAVARKP